MSASRRRQHAAARHSRQGRRTLASGIALAAVVGGIGVGTVGAQAAASHRADRQRAHQWGAPVYAPTAAPSASPTSSATAKPTAAPSASPTGAKPTATGTAKPTSAKPTSAPAPSQPAGNGRNLASLTLAPLSSKGGKTFHTTVQSTANEQFGEASINVWIPDGATQVYGVMVPGVFNDFTPGNGKDAVPTGGWRDVAAKYHLAVLGHGYTHKNGVKDRREVYGEYGAGAGLLRGLTALAASSGHKELATAGLIMDGYSLGTAMGRGMAQIAPERIAGMTLGGSSFPDVKAFPKTAQIPILVYGGALDSGTNGEAANLAKGRAVKAPWAFTLQPNRGHDVKPTSDISGTFQIGAALARLNATPGGPLLPVDLGKGWLGAAKGASIAAYGDFKGDLTSASWLPTKAAAVEWQAFWTR